MISRQRAERGQIGPRPRRLFVSGLLVLALVTISCGSKPGTGVNTGQSGSTCAASDGGLAYTPPGPGVSTTALATAPAYYELGAPAGPFAGQPPKGLMMTVHGGGWYTVGRGAVASERPWADTWRTRGWETLNITYRACALSLGDVLWFHDAARRMVGPTMPICAIGESAGAQLALMMASLRPDVACVIGEGAPTDLLTLPRETAYNPKTHTSDQTSGPLWLYNLAIAAFGVHQLGAMSPALHPAKARLLLATAAEDEFVPWAQTHDMAAAVQAVHPGAYVTADQLAAGSDVEFTHTSRAQGTGVSLAANEDYLQRQLQVVAPAVGPPG